jgi:glycosyltransferase involved in cell wall biosynthesis
MEKELTIVIPCKNEEEYIGRLLEEISLQRVGSTEIILADANSTDKTVEEAVKTSFHLGLNLRVAPGGLPAVGRNRGAFLAKTKYVLFVDADVTFTNKFSLLDCLEKTKEGDYDMMTTTPVYRGDGNFRASALFFLNKISTKWLSKRSPFAIGAFTLIKKEKFEDLGGYDEEVKHTEDWLLSKKVKPSKFLLIPDLITQDDRRFKKFGYLRMITLCWMNWVNQNNQDYFLRDAGYWKEYSK